MSGFWESCLLRFEQELPAQQFNTWIKPLRLEGEDAPEEGLRLLAPNSFILKWVRDRYLTRIEDYCRSFFSAPVSIALAVGERKPASPPARSPDQAPVATPASFTRFSPACPMDAQRAFSSVSASSAACVSN